ncbi:MAG: phenylacetate-CoA oxygenase subunit PaaI [Acidobacteria bacterium]|nr:phenylacetate-CoA oxygenase subunit PaaI [Acidobacteriota bacterium]
MFTEKIEADDFPKMPPKYRELLLKVLTIQCDSELGGPHLYVEKWILNAPTAEDQMLLAKTAAEEIDHHRKFVKVLRELGVDLSHLIHTRSSDRVLEIFHEPLETWADMGTFGTFIDRVGGYHLEDFSDSSYLPVARIIPRILEEEKMHIAHGIRILRQLCETEEGKAQAQQSLDKTYPRALDMFGLSGSKRSEEFKEWGIKRRTNVEARTEYMAEAREVISGLGLKEPDPLRNRRYL